MMQRRNFFKAILGGVAALAATRLGAERSVEAAGTTHPLPAAPMFVSGFDAGKGDQIAQGTFALEDGEMRLVSSRILPWAETFPLASQWPPVPLPSPRKSVYAQRADRGESVLTLQDKQLAHMLLAQDWAMTLAQVDAFLAEIPCDPEQVMWGRLLGPPPFPKPSGDFVDW